MRRLLTPFLAAILTAACASSAQPPAATPPERAPRPSAETPPPEPEPGPPESEPVMEPEPEPGPDPEAAAVRTAPDRWWQQAVVEEDVPAADLDEAHALLAGRAPERTVVVAVIDGGVDIGHEDLDDVLWVNEDEVPGNGVDDDGNGYIDDVHGWNFIGGPDGRNVDHDTYEMTRIHAACIGAAAAGPMESPGPERCAEVKEAYDAEHAEMTAIAQQIGQIQQIYPIVVQILGNAVGAPPTPEAVGALEPTDPRVAQAKLVYLQLADLGIDEEALAEQAEEVENRLTYGLDVEFDPRPIVGDDYADKTERIYGNPDVIGPDAGHGTSVASVIAAERDNEVGIQGAATGVRIMPVRAVPNGDERDKDIANAIRYAVDNGAHIINMSFGKGFSPYKEVVDEAVRHADRNGVLLVHAAGNDGVDLAVEPNFPTDRYLGGDIADGWIEVGASSWQAPDSLAAGFSNYGETDVDVFAPGVAILAAAPGNAYEPADGTSVAAPVVSGVAALLMAYFPELDALEVKRIILETATGLGERMVARPGPDDGTIAFSRLAATGGIVDAEAAVRRAMAVTGRANDADSPDARP